MFRVLTLRRSFFWAFEEKVGKGEGGEVLEHPID